MHNSSALSHPWLHRGRLTCMPLHSAANYFPLRETTAVLTQILTHSATAFEEYFPPSPSYSVRKRKKCYLECAPLEINLFQSDLHWFSKGFYDRCAKGCNYLYLYFRLCCCWGPEVRHKVEVAQKRSSDTRDDDRRKSGLRPNPALSSVPASHVKTGFK